MSHALSPAAKSGQDVDIIMKIINTLLYLHHGHSSPVSEEAVHERSATCSVTCLEHGNELKHNHYQHNHVQDHLALPHCHLQGLENVKTLESPETLMSGWHLRVCKQNSDEFAEQNYWMEKAIL
jgi:hypothetical protein